MTAAELTLAVEQEGWEWAHIVHEGAEAYAIHWPRLMDGECTIVVAAELPGLTWDQVRAQVVAGRDVHHIARIIGYFSRVENWNASKRGELRARHAGHYGTGIAMPAPAWLPPDADQYPQLAWRTGRG